MRLPAVTIAAAFACGIVLGLQPAVVHHASSVSLLLSFFSLTALLILVGFLLAKFDHLVPAAAASLLNWVLLGFLGAIIAEQPRSPDHVISLVEQQHIDLKTPLRWHGRLRDEPARLPWGWGYEIELSGVEFEGVLQPARGGLRVSFTPRPDGRLPPEVHAGDQVYVVTEAKQPQVFSDSNSGELSSRNTLDRA